MQTGWLCALVHGTRIGGPAPAHYWADLSELYPFVSLKQGNDQVLVYVIERHPASNCPMKKANPPGPKLKREGKRSSVPVAHRPA